MTKRGIKNDEAKLPNLRLAPIAAKPAPVIPPTNACVVEIGKPKAVASITVTAAANTTDIAKVGIAVMTSGTRPFPENATINALARKRADKLPASVAQVVKINARRYETTLQP